MYTLNHHFSIANLIGKLVGSESEADIAALKIDGRFNPKANIGRRS
jgi:hypothetical protein